MDVLSDVLSAIRLDGAAHLSGADLTYSHDLTQAQLDRACGDESTKLPSATFSIPRYVTD